MRRSVVIAIILVALFLGFLWLSSSRENIERDGADLPQNESVISDKQFKSNIYRVSFIYPGEWDNIEYFNFSGGAEGEPVRVSGDTGFAGVDAIFAADNTLEGAVRSLTTHRLSPYGSNPTILRTEMSGQEAALVFPSSDQHEGARGEGVFVVRYPAPVIIDGTEYVFFVLYADTDHLQEIAGTVSFID